MKKRQFIVLTAALTLAVSMTAFGGGWQQQPSGRWWYLKDSGAITASTVSWHQDSAGNWYLGSSRDQSDNRWTSNGWFWVYDAAAGNMKCYYFDGEGYLLTSTTTPDGYQVNEKGEWVKDGAVVVINPPAPLPVMKADFDYSQYLPGNYEATAAARKQQAGWQKDANGWQYRKADGQYCANGWFWVFDSSIQGMKCYYFNPQGYLLLNGTAPDGYQVNANGEWIQDGAVQVVTAPKAAAVLSNDELKQAQSPSATGNNSSISGIQNANRYTTSNATGTSGAGGNSSGRDTSRDDSSANGASGNESDRVQVYKKVLDQALSKAIPNQYNISADGENITINLWSNRADDNFIQLLQYGNATTLTKWDEVKSSFMRIANTYYRTYQSAGLNATFRMNQVSSSNHSRKLLSYENGSCTYDVVDANDNSKQENFKQLMNDLLKKTDYANRFRINLSGKDCTISLWTDAGMDDMLARDRQWGELKNTIQKLAQQFYGYYQNEYGLNGTFSLIFVSARDKSTSLIRFDNGTLAYDILRDDPAALDELVGNSQTSDDTTDEEQDDASDETENDSRYEEDEEDASDSSGSLSEEDEKRIEKFYEYYPSKIKMLLSASKIDDCTVSRDGSDITITAWGKQFDEVYENYMAGNDKTGAGWGLTKSGLVLSMRLENKTFWNEYRKDSVNNNGTITLHVVSAKDKDKEILTFENGVCTYDASEE